MKLAKIVSVVSLVMGLVACGGGGGSPGTVTSGTGGGAASPQGTASQPVGTPTLTVGIYRAGTSVAVNAVSFGASYEARATLRDANGLPVANQLVQFSMGSFTNVLLSPASLVTGTDGVATVTVAPASISSLGGATLAAITTVGGVGLSAETSFNVASTNVTLSAISVGASNLPSAGTTPLSLTVNIGGAPASGVPINVTFTASCGRINGGVSSASVTSDGNGLAAATYDAINSSGSLCSGPVTLSASSAGAVSANPTTITVAAASANAVTYVSPSGSEKIFVAGSGALEQYVAQFKVLSGLTPMPNQSVIFSLLVNPGGVGLGATGVAGPVTLTTDSSGIASITVFSGSIPGPVKVRATLASNAQVFAETQNLTVASGPPSQRFMSLSAEAYNLEGASRDGTTTNLTVRIADRQGNSVEDGTVVNFVAEGGQVSNRCATKQDANLISKCSVTFETQNPRPRMDVYLYWLICREPKIIWTTIPTMCLIQQIL